MSDQCHVGDCFVIPQPTLAPQAMFGQIESTFSSGLAGHLTASKAASDSATAAVKEAAAQLREVARQVSAGGATLGAGGGRPGGGISLAELEAQKDPKHVITGEGLK